MGGAGFFDVDNSGNNEFQWRHYYQRPGNFSSAIVMRTVIRGQAPFSIMVCWFLTAQDFHPGGEHTIGRNFRHWIITNIGTGAVT